MKKTCHYLKRSNKSSLYKYVSSIPKVFIDMNSEHYRKLHEMIATALDAHQLADWSNKTAREMITKMIMKKFKEYMDVYE